jgi:GNAT superfamily N-acetyltransferase
MWPADPVGWLTPAGLVQAWVAEVDGRVVAHVALVAPSPIGEPLEISRLFVASSARGHGVASALLAEANERAARRRLVLDVVDAAGPAIALYERLGWRLIDRSPAEWTTRDGQHPIVRRYAAPVVRGGQGLGTHRTCLPKLVPPPLPTPSPE